MKRYKLLKDLPTFKAGDEFYLDSNNSLRLKGLDIMAYNHKTLEKFPNILTDWFEEIPEEYKRWRAEYDKRYAYIGNDGLIYFEYECGDFINNYHYNTGNYFHSEEEAEAYRKYLLARQALIDDAEGGKWLKNDENLVVFHTDSDIDEWVRASAESYLLGVIYFKTKASLRKSLEEHKEQWEIVRKYEMGE